DRLLKLGLVALMIGMPRTLQATATINIVNMDGAGEGFNDPTPAVPVGGNTGTTIGAQRLIAFQHAADLWGAQINSSVPINVAASFDPLFCSDTAAVLGSAAPISVHANFPGMLLINHWYPAALANKIRGADLLTNNEIMARFNSNLGQANCLSGLFFYYGLDNNHGALLDLVAVVLHELGHGLGFLTVTNGSTGAYVGGLPSAFDHFVLDLNSNKLWDQMTNAERAASAISPRKVVWNGNVTTSMVPLVLQAGTAEMVISLPANVAGTYLV